MKPAWASPMAERTAPCTKWCIGCARVSLSRVATCLVDDDPLCENCGPRVAAETGCEAVPLRPAQAPATQLPVSPATPALPPSPAPQPQPKEQPMKLSAAAVEAIRNADPSISNVELAQKYGVTNVTVSYHRRKGGNPSQAKVPRGPYKKFSAASTGVAKQSLPSNRSSEGAAVTVAISFELNDARADSMWATFSLDQKAVAIRAGLTAQPGQA
jgi:hypothetical protein